MNLILRQVIGYQQGRKASGTNPKLTQELKDTQKQLNSILNKWKFGDEPIKTSEEFLELFGNWVQKKLEQQRDLKVFLAKKGASSLEDLADLPTEESEQLKFFKDNIKIKEEIINDYKEKEQTWQNTEEDYLQRIEELKASSATSEATETIRQELARKEELWKNTEQDYLRKIADHDREIENKVKEFQTSNGELLKRIEELENRETSELPEDYEDLITERDEALREKKTLEQSVLALNNRLNLKQQEVSNKDKALDKLKKEKSQLELTQQKALKEKNTLITTLNQEIKQHKEKYSKQGKLLDEEQLECKKLEEKVETLEAEIRTLKGGRA